MGNPLPMIIGSNPRSAAALARRRQAQMYREQMDAKDAPEKQGADAVKDVAGMAKDGGMKLRDGAKQYWSDAESWINGHPLEAFGVGIAVGYVLYAYRRNIPVVGKFLPVLNSGV